MNAGLALGLLALAQLLLAWLADRALAAVDRPWFVDQAEKRGSDGLDIKEFLTAPEEGKGSARTDAILRMAGLAAAARSVAAALLVSVVGLIVTGVIIFAAENPPLLWLRVLGVAVALVLTGGALFVLMAKMADRSLRSAAPGEAALRRPATSRGGRWSVALLRLRCPTVITRYYAAALVGNVIVVAAAYGL